MSRLVGLDAELYLGTASSGRWTDLERVVPAPPFTTGESAGLQRYTIDDRERIASVHPIPGTPWHAAVGFPVAPILAPVNAFLARVVVLALIALAVALVLTWFVSRRIIFSGNSAAWNYFEKGSKCGAFGLDGVEGGRRVRLVA